MFTGIIEEVGEVVDLRTEQSNLRISLSATFISELKVDQSVNHNGVCMTVEKIRARAYDVVAIKETLIRSNIGQFKKGQLVNLERSLVVGSRLDGHIVQGHVDSTAICEKIHNLKGSWIFRFSYPDMYKDLVIEKGSICVNGVSLTVVDLMDNYFSVAIIPYTYEHTNFKYIKVGALVNLEYRHSWEIHFSPTLFIKTTL